MPVFRFDDQECPLIFPNKTPDYEEKFLASIEKSLQFSKKLINAGEYDLIVLDEVLNLLGNDYIAADKILELFNVKGDTTELILTGRNASEEIVAAADLVTEMKLHKHPYYQGLAARKGIEF